VARACRELRGWVQKGFRCGTCCKFLAIHRLEMSPTDFVFALRGARLFVAFRYKSTNPIGINKRCFMKMLSRAPGKRGAAADALPWEILTQIDLKKQIYQYDLEFKYCWGLFQHLDHDVRANILKTCCIVTLKTETIFKRQAQFVFEYLSRAGLQIVHAENINITNNMVGAAWRYYMNMATPCRLHLHFDVLSQRPAVVLVCRLPEKDPTQLCTEFLAPVKNNLRESLGQTNFFLNYIHSCDEPADFIRELPVWLGGAGLRRFIETAASLNLRPEKAPCISNLDSELHKIYSAIEETDFNPRAALERIRRIIKTTPESKSIIDHIDKTLEDSEASLIAWPIINHLNKQKCSYSRWDLYLALSEFIQHVDASKNPIFN
jgi:hypothetical protein